MAGDWIKVEHATLDKPEVSLFSELLGVPVDQGVGILVRFWVWLDRNARNGTVTHVTPSVMDTVMHCPGFAGAMLAVGWVKFDEALRTMTVPNFERHNETPAKTRSSNAERQARFRERHRNVTGVTEPLPEKRREEIDTSLRSVSSRQQIDAPTTEHRELAKGLGIDCDVEWLQYRDHFAANGKRHRDEVAGFRKWLRKAATFKPASRSSLADQRAATVAAMLSHAKRPDDSIIGTAERLD